MILQITTLALLLSAPALAGSDGPKLTMQASQTMGRNPLSVSFTARIVGGQDSAMEPWYCPEVVWEVNGRESLTHKPDCSPFRASDETEDTGRYKRRDDGVWIHYFVFHPASEIIRVFRYEACFHGGEHEVRLVLRHAGQEIASVHRTIRVDYESTLGTGNCRGVHP